MTGTSNILNDLGHSKLRRDRPVPEDRHLRQKGVVPARLRLPVAVGDAHQSRPGRHLRRHAGRRRGAAGRHQSDCGHIHGAEYGAAVYGFLVGRVEA